jgi:hypothetical protein
VCEIEFHCLFLQLEVTRLEQSIARICVVSGSLDLIFTSFLFPFFFFKKKKLFEGINDKRVQISNKYAFLYFQGLCLTCTLEMFRCQSKRKKRLAKM